MHAGVVNDHDALAGDRAHDVRRRAASLARIPTSFFSLSLLRLYLTLDILVPDPNGWVKGMVQKALLELGTIGSIAAIDARI